MARFSVISTMRDESPFILEWVAHHIALGFDNIVIATNDCDDYTVEIIKRLSELVSVEHHATIKGRGGIQMSALRQMAYEHPSVTNSDWIYVCDADEFLNVKVGDGSVSALIDYFGEDKDAIAIPWRIFGNNGIDRFEDRFVTDQFTHAETGAITKQNRNAAGKHPKSITSGRILNKLKRIGVHAPMVKPEFEDEIKVTQARKISEELHPDKIDSRFQIAQVNHYILRSKDAFRIKNRRGNININKASYGAVYWKQWNFNNIEERSISRYDKAKLEIYNELRSDPVLNWLHEHSVDWYHETCKALAIKKRKRLREARRQKALSQITG